MTTAEELISGLSDDLEPVRVVAKRFLGADSCVDPATGALCASHRPRIAPLAYALRIFPGAGRSLIASYEGVHEIKICGSYRSLLMRMNGAYLFQIDLFGIPPTMATCPPLLDRSALWLLDLATAQKYWWRKYTTGEDCFVGYGPYSSNDPLGYFMSEDGAVRAVQVGGAVFRSWPSVRGFLTDELARAESAFPTYEQTMAGTVENVRPRKTPRKADRGPGGVQLR